MLGQQPMFMLQSLDFGLELVALILGSQQRVTQHLVGITLGADVGGIGQQRFPRLGAALVAPVTDHPGAGVGQGAQRQELLA
ncbi:hypothetical protein D3C80_2022410 [compost metagenome]